MDRVGADIFDQVGNRPKGFVEADLDVARRAQGPVSRQVEAVERLFEERHAESAEAPRLPRRLSERIAAIGVDLDDAVAGHLAGILHECDVAGLAMHADLDVEHVVAGL